MLNNNNEKFTIELIEEWRKNFKKLLFSTNEAIINRLDSFIVIMGH